MKKKEKRKIPGVGKGLWILIVAAVVLEGTACVQYFTARTSIRKEAEKLAKTELLRAELEIEKHTIEMETAAKALAMMAEKYVDCPDSIFSATRSVVAILNENTSIAVAYVPGYFEGKRTKGKGERIGRFFEPCSSRFSEDSIYTRQIGSAEHDYTLMEWYQNGFIHDSCWWCEPYLDDSGSKTFVVSCSCPVHDRKGQVVAVVCVDLSLDYLQSMSEYLRVYPESFYSITSSTGEQIVPIGDTLPGRKYQSFDEEIDATGWHIEIIIPDDVIYADLRQVGLMIFIMMIIGLAVLVFITTRAARNLIELMNLSHDQERMDSELTIARNIQMAMLPTRFPPFPDYPNLSAFGVVIPAREVGGDLFDFHIRDNRLFFCIGDVSGKGVPASLVMAMTRSLFRSFSAYLDNPAQIVSQINDSLSGEGNKQDMFVTLFLGILDLSSGELHFCNAGHNAPIHVPSSPVPCTILDCLANLPLGVLAGFEYQEQSAQLEVGDALFLYTDGLTEAENGTHQLFGEQRMMSIVESQKSKEKSPQELIEAMQQAVAAFVNGAEQSDDLTMFAIRLINLSTLNSQLSTLKNNHFSLVMRNDIQQIPTLAEWIDSIEMPEELNMPINLALEEAVSNVMLYAYPGTNGQVLVECEKSQEPTTNSQQLIFTITDSGIPFDPTQQKEADITLSVEERQIGGLGIHLVRQIMDDIRYERKDNKNILTLVKSLNC